MAAEWWANQNPDKTVAVIFPDEGHRYTETVYDEAWLGTIEGWPAEVPEEPTLVRTPREELAGWSHFYWGRRLLKDVLAGADEAALDSASNGRPPMASAVSTS
jgi:cysteine synthase A